MPGWFSQPYSTKVDPDMEPARQSLATVAIRILRLATLLLTILVVGCNGDGSGY